MIAKTWWMAVLCGAALAFPAMAQQGGGAPDEIPQQAPPETETKEPAAATEPPPKKKSNLEDPPLHRWGGWTISVAAWSPTIIGGNPAISATQTPSGYFTPVTISTDADLRESWLVAYHLPDDLGSIVGHYDSMNDQDSRFVSTPGDFRYLETLAFPAFRGGFDDGFADAVGAQNMNKTREVRLEYSNVAWSAKHSRATWGAGVRNVDHNEQMQVWYHGLVPNLPSTIPPIIDPAIDPRQFNPRSDTVFIQSDYSGTGAGVSLDVEFTLHPRFSVISGLSLGLIRGKVSTTYKSINWFYQSAVDGHYIGRQELIDTLQFGPVHCDDTHPLCIDAITQEDVFNGYYAPDVSQASQTFDAYVGFQSMVWRGLRVFATFREMYYQNVGASAIPTTDFVISTETKSVGYEGYLLGVSWRF